ncbi:helix-turn-helix domain containing protein [Streptomyces sp. NBC_00371]|uniref:helix-turn-helix domain-containing protein n=1 Tax=Streptomyces sp. NBC_00371 TaxID=2975729 RepID=UPI002E267163
MSRACPAGGARAGSRSRKEGVEVPCIARELRVSEKSVYQWRRTWRTGGREALRSRGHRRGQRTASVPLRGACAARRSARPRPDTACLRRTSPDGPRHRSRHRSRPRNAKVSNDGVLDDDAVPLVIATLIAAGVPEKRASDVVVDVFAVITAEPGFGDGT